MGHPWILDLPYAPGDVREYDREARANHWSITGILPPYAKAGYTIPSRPTKKKTERPKRDSPTTKGEKPQPVERTEEDDCIFPLSYLFRVIFPAFKSRLASMRSRTAISEVGRALCPRSFMAGFDCN